MMENVIEALSEGGIPANRGMPAGKIPQITGSVAAVSLHAMDMRNKKVTVLVRILTSASLGAGVCEDTAISAGQILTERGSKCNVGKCRFDSRIGLFCTDVTTEFNSEVPKVTINGVLLTHVQAFTSWRAMDEETTEWNLAKWNFRLEEYFPMGEDEDADPSGAFTLVHVSPSGTENFINATWTSQRRIWDASGVRQIRQGMAEEMNVG